jgi:hypothetical protein
MLSLVRSERTELHARSCDGWLCLIGCRAVEVKGGGSEQSGKFHPHAEADEDARGGKRLDEGSKTASSMQSLVRFVPEN